MEEPAFVLAGKLVAGDGRGTQFDTEWSVLISDRCAAAVARLVGAAGAALGRFRMMTYFGQPEDPRPQCQHGVSAGRNSKNRPVSYDISPGRKGAGKRGLECGAGHSLTGDQRTYRN